MQLENEFNQSFWDVRWENNQTGWDIGEPSPAITTYLAQYSDKNTAILISGCGNAHEAGWLLKNGFTNITLIDIAPKAVDILKEKFALKPQVKILCEDFFEHNGNYDLIIEQTFFCAIPPERRTEYVDKMTAILNQNGRIIGVLFNIEFNQQLPPFGGSITEYKQLFETKFIIKKMDDCYYSK
ncbi:MAG: methyltransferase domain-containing protein [Flavobacterium sp.]|nr:MAG: methyltransferase domain-containing protein [Flavobacterium sp.]